VWPKGYDFSAILVIINRILILVNELFRVTVAAATVIKWGIKFFGQVINRAAKITAFGHKQGKGFGKRVAHPTQLLWEYPLPPPWRGWG